MFHHLEKKRRGACSGGGGGGGWGRSQGQDQARGQQRSGCGLGRSIGAGRHQPLLSAPDASLAGREWGGKCCGHRRLKRDTQMAGTCRHITEDKAESEVFANREANQTVEAAMLPQRVSSTSPQRHRGAHQFQAQAADQVGVSVGERICRLCRLQCDISDLRCKRGVSWFAAINAKDANHV